MTMPPSSLSSSFIRAIFAASRPRRPAASPIQFQRLASTKHPQNFVPPTLDDLQELRERTQEFARREIGEGVAQTTDHSNEFPMEMWKKMGDAGFLGITADEEYGGLAMGYQAHCIVMEELSRASGKLRPPFPDMLGCRSITQA